MSQHQEPDPLFPINQSIPLEEHWRNDFHASRERVNFFVKPVSRERHRKVSAVHNFIFDQGHKDHSMPAPDGLYLPLAGICFPGYVPDEGLAGYVTLAGFHLQTRKLWIWGERKFLTIEPGLAQDDYPADTPPPAKGFLATCMKFFQIRHMFYHETEQVLQKHIPAIHRSFPKPPRPPLSNFRWSDFKIAMITMQEWMVLDKVRYPDGRIWGEMQAYEADQDEFYPALQSVCIMINGLDRILRHDSQIRNLIEQFPAPRRPEDKNTYLESFYGE